MDSVPAQRKFAEELGVEYTLLSDFQREVSRLYGVLSDRGFSRRTTFVIDKEGLIRRIESGREAIDVAGAKEACAQLQ